MMEETISYPQKERAADVAADGEITADGSAKPDITVLQDELTGALVGLVRATENNEHLITDELNRLIMEGLMITVMKEGFDSSRVTELTGRVRAAKERLVPDCYHCASPCGRTDDYDMRSVWDADRDVCALKSLILFAARGMAAEAYQASLCGQKDEAVNHFFYKALFAVGMDWGKEELLPVAMEAGEVHQKCRELLVQMQHGR